MLHCVWLPCYDFLKQFLIFLLETGTLAIIQSGQEKSLGSVDKPLSLKTRILSLGPYSRSQEAAPASCSLTSMTSMTRPLPRPLHLLEITMGLRDQGASAVLSEDLGSLFRTHIGSLSPCFTPTSGDPAPSGSASTCTCWT